MFNEIVIDNLRILEHAVFRPVPGLNLITGVNGAGKTTLIEALFLLSTGRSFRHRETGPLIREEQAFVQLVGKFLDRHHNPHVLGMRREAGNLVVQLDGRGNLKRSEILQLLPLQFIGADPQQLVSGAPELRRGFLDSGLFHVEPGYLKLIQRYGRILAQRNAMLRDGQTDTSEWDRQLHTTGEQISVLRQHYVERLIPVVENILHEWELSITLRFTYQQGWPRDMDFEDALSRAGERDHRRRFTSVGPHRADLAINARSIRSGKILSRGQLKMLVIAMYLAQAKLQKEAAQDVLVLLLDDLAAELDRANRERVIDAITNHYPQTVVTALEADDIPVSETPSVFHVEHGTLSSR